MCVCLFFYSYINQFLLEGQMVEVIWTMLPAITLVFIGAAVSTFIVPMLDKFGSPALTLKNYNKGMSGYNYLRRAK